MQRPIGYATKRAVIEEYLKGKNRDPIASDLGLATGTVSKIIKEWKTGLDYPNADELRELVLGLRKLGISASRYAQGARIASYLVEMGVDEEEFRQFVSGIYDS
ncbi:MAG: helix-turn-helix domain-containing protein, partial [Candidatus Nitrosopolaris sp.]